MTTHEFTGHLQLLSSQALKTLQSLPPQPPPQKGELLSIRLAAGPARVLATAASQGHAPRWNDDAQDRDHVAAATALKMLVHADMRLADPAGHVRPVYFYLAVHLYLTACRNNVSHCPPDILPQLRQLADRIEGLSETTADLALWLALVMLQAGLLLGDDALASRARALAGQWLDVSPRDGSLHEMTADDSLDAWTWRELVGLGAADHLARLTQNHVWRERCRNITAYHVDNTQPDNTTTQPWGIAAFLCEPAAVDFGVQQMHDAMTQGSHDGGRQVGLVAAMLMADAAWALSSSGSG